MKTNRKSILTVAILSLGMLIGTSAQAQTCCSKKAEAKKCCSTGHAESSANTETSGCAPSSCRGAQTKFNEAKVITTLRADLIALKAEMEKSQSPAYSERSYDIHGIVGETDEESIEIIAREVKLVEAELAAKAKISVKEFNLPEQKAAQIKYLNQRIEALRKLV